MASTQSQIELHKAAIEFLERGIDDRDVDLPDGNDENSVMIVPSRNDRNLLDPAKKGSKAMLQSLQNIQQALACPLCDNVLVEPVTIPCGHTFCCSCIDDHVDNNWYCPIQSCKMPVSMKGSRPGVKFRQINPSIQTIVTSWTKICHTMMQAEDYWWQDLPSDDEDLDFQKEQNERLLEEVFDSQNSITVHKTKVVKEPDDENTMDMIDLQANLEIDPRKNQSDDDEEK